MLPSQHIASVIATAGQEREQGSRQGIFTDSGWNRQCLERISYELLTGPWVNIQMLATIQFGQDKKQRSKVSFRDLGSGWALKQKECSFCLTPRTLPWTTEGYCNGWDQRVCHPQITARSPDLPMLPAAVRWQLQNQVHMTSFPALSLPAEKILKLFQFLHLLNGMTKTHPYWVLVTNKAMQLKNPVLGLAYN